MANEKNDPNSIWFAQRAPVRMSRDMLDNIESMMSSGHTPSEISRDMGLTPESVELGIEKVKARQREQTKSKRGGLFSTEARHARVRRTCDEIGCPWRSNGQLYCTLPSCFNETFKHHHKHTVFGSAFYEYDLKYLTPHRKEDERNG